VPNTTILGLCTSGATDCGLQIKAMSVEVDFAADYTGVYSPADDNLVEFLKARGSGAIGFQRVAAYSVGGEYELKLRQTGCCCYADYTPLSNESFGFSFPVSVEASAISDVSSVEREYVRTVTIDVEFPVTGTSAGDFYCRKVDGVYMPEFYEFPRMNFSVSNFNGVYISSPGIDFSPVGFPSVKTTDGDTSIDQENAVFSLSSWDVDVVMGATAEDYQSYRFTGTITTTMQDGLSNPVGILESRIEIRVTLGVIAATGGGNNGTAGLSGGSLITGSLTTGALTTGGLSSGGLVTGQLETSSLTSGTLYTGGLESGTLQTGGLTTGSLETGGLTAGGL
jgi:hypothetical protein